MQTLKMFSVRDVKGEVFNPPYFARSHGEAERSFIQLSRDPQSTVSQFPQDYDLYYLGDYDDQTGVCRQDTPPKLVMNAATAKDKN